jgi:hypothetical protein
LLANAWFRLPAVARHTNAVLALRVFTASMKAVFILLAAGSLHLMDATHVFARPLVLLYARRTTVLLVSMLGITWMLAVLSLVILLKLLPVIGVMFAVVLKDAQCARILSVLFVAVT